MKYFSSKLRALRECKKLSQQAMAAASRMSRQTYADLESGKTEPRYSTINFLSEFFNVPVDYWFEESSSPLTPEAKEILAMPPEVQQSFIATYKSIRCGFRL